MAHPTGSTGAAGSDYGLLEQLRAAVLSMVRDLRTDHLTARQLGILMLTEHEDGPRTVRGLAAALGIDKSVVTRATDKLVATGFAQRAGEPGHARSVLITPTPSGRALLRQMAATMAVQRVGASVNAPRRG